MTPISIDKRANTPHIVSTGIRSELFAGQFIKSILLFSIHLFVIFHRQEKHSLARTSMKHRKFP